MRRQYRVIGLWFLILVPGLLPAQVRIHVTPYLGAGFSRILTDYTPPFAADDSLSQEYYALNLANPPRNAVRGQLRIDVLELWNFRFGYFLWGHQVEYDDTTPSGLVQVDKRYPQEYYYTLQGVSLAWNLDYRGLATPHRVPFVVGGLGRYRGDDTYVYYTWTDESHSQLETRHERGTRFEDWGFFAGAGVTLWKYFYAYAGVTELLGEGLPGSRFLDVIVGVTF